MFCLLFGILAMELPGNTAIHLSGVAICSYEKVGTLIDHEYYRREVCWSISGVTIPRNLLIAGPRDSSQKVMISLTSTEY